MDTLLLVSFSLEGWVACACDSGSAELDKEIVCACDSGGTIHGQSSGANNHQTELDELDTAGVDAVMSPFEASQVALHNKHFLSTTNRTIGADRFLHRGWWLL